MVKQVKIALAFMRMIRFPNLVIIAITQYFIRWFILKPLLSVSNFKVQLNTLQFALLVLSTTLIAAAGYIINDYFDRKTDLINRPGRVIVGRMISRRYAMAFHVVFTLLGILAGAYLAYSIHRLSLTIVFIFVSGVLWFYSTTYKRQLLVGNIIISILVGMVPLLVLLFEFPLLVIRYKLYILASGVNFDYLIFWVGSYAIFAFIVNLIREIIKDMEDFEGDYVFGRQTIPITWGMNTARWIVIALIGIMIVPIVYLLVKHLSDKISFVYIVFFIIVPLIILAFGVNWASSKKQYHTLSQISKLIMLSGLVYCPVVNYIVAAYKQ
ncbi:1,4-dihydroxy-2-naphthoate octaprenyltransferase [subsurface metagenome]